MAFGRKDISSEVLIVDTDARRLSRFSSILAARYSQVSTSSSHEFNVRYKKAPEIPRTFCILVLGDGVTIQCLNNLAESLVTDERHRPAGILQLRSINMTAEYEQKIKTLFNKTLFFFDDPISGEGDLLSILELILELNYEREVRFNQENHLINELAERKIMEARLKYLVSHDELTGLANRRSLEKNIELAVYRGIKFSKTGALLYIDLDRFNVINDIEGYETGDRLLVEIVTAIRGYLKPDQYFARIGSDEFCIYLENTTSMEAMLAAEDIRQLIDDIDLVTENEKFSITASIGIALLPPNTQIHPNAFIVQAHQACFLAKSHGRNCIHIYKDNDAALLRRRDDVEWYPLIRRALTEDRFELHFQPVVRLHNGRIEHYEVLLRMRGADNTLYPPGKFIPVAERTGIINTLDLWVLDRATDFLARLPEQEAGVGININLSSASFMDPSVVQLLQQKLTTNWVNPSRITFEITESVALANLVQSREIISRIRALGCRFAIDDFGTGFSSFHYLKHFHVDFLKIDGQFIRNLVTDKTDQVLVKAMIDIARQLGKQTVAEYVHDVRILPLLKSLRVDFVQGYLLGKPMKTLLPSQVLPISELVRQGEDFASQPMTEVGL